MFQGRRQLRNPRISLPQPVTVAPQDDADQAARSGVFIEPGSFVGVRNEGGDFTSVVSQFFRRRLSRVR